MLRVPRARRAAYTGPSGAVPPHPHVYQRDPRHLAFNYVRTLSERREFL